MQQAIVPVTSACICTHDHHHALMPHSTGLRISGSLNPNVMCTLPAGSSTLLALHGKHAGMIAVSNAGVR